MEEIMERDEEKRNKMISEMLEAEEVEKLKDLSEYEEDKLAEMEGRLVRVRE